jgi:hypothetical protein
MAADGVEFDECYATKVSVDIDGTKVDFIDLDHLKANKHATGRMQDMADLDALENMEK